MVTVNHYFQKYQFVPYIVGIALIACRSGGGVDFIMDEDRCRDHLKAVFSNLPLDLIISEMLDRLKTELSAKLTPSTARKVFELVRGVFNFSIKRKLWRGVDSLIRPFN